MLNRHRISLTALSICVLLSCRTPRFDVANDHAVFCAASMSTCDWMQGVIQHHSMAALTDICLPGSHDAAMYISQHCTAFTNHGNTQTQYLTMRHQLEAGVRIYDLRPVLYHGEYYTEHCTKCDGLGCKGDLMSNILRDTRSFLDAHAELVIFEVSHFCHSSYTDTALLSLLTTTLGDRIYREDAAHAGTPTLIHTPIAQLIGSDGRGKVVLILEGMPNTPANRANGWYSSEALPMAGGWSNDNKYPLLRDHQQERLAKYPGNGAALYQLAWQITQHNPQAVRSAFDPHSPTTIRKGAAYANSQLPLFIDSLITHGAIRAGKIPNLIWDDLADTMVTRQCIRLTELNLK